MPIDLKSGTAGAMRSLHQFMFDKKLRFAVRFDENQLAQFEVHVRTTLGGDVTHRLRSHPWYLAGLRPKRLVDNG